MNLKIGIVGLPNAGKSTLFNALLKKQVASVAPYPFCTIEPNVGVVPVPDERLEALATLVEREDGVKPPLVPAVVEFVDIAGLVKGASVGEGLGNKFLSHIREVDIVCHVLRSFSDPSVVNVAGDNDRDRDAGIVTTELILADLQTLGKQTEPKNASDPKILRKWELIQTLVAHLNTGKVSRDVVTNPDDEVLITDLHLLTMKPTITILNVSEQELTNPTFLLEAGKLWPGALLISAKTEVELIALPKLEQEQYLDSLGLTESGLDRLIQKSYETLGLISFLTAGVKEVRAWTIEQGALAPQAAGVIHTDFEKKFIKAEVISFDDVVVVGGWKKAKELGKLRMEGREYVMRDGDVVEFKIGA